MPIRKIPKNYRNVTGIIADTKAVGEAQFESPLERDFISLLEFSPEVVRYEVQPVKIEWPDEQGKARFYRPDILVNFHEALNRRPWLCEVKYRADLKKNWDELHPRLLQGIRYAKQREWRFHVISEIEIRTHYLDNVRFLLPFRRRATPQRLIDDVLGVVGSMEGATVEKVLQSLSGDRWQQAEWLPAIWHLIATWRIETDLDLGLTMTSPLRSVA